MTEEEFIEQRDLMRKIHNDEVYLEQIKGKSKKDILYLNQLHKKAEKKKQFLWTYLN